MGRVQADKMRKAKTEYESSESAARELLKVPHSEIKSTLKSEPAMNPSVEQTLVEVSRQALVENAKFVELGRELSRVRRTRF
jgi:hypothetical protein